MEPLLIEAKLLGAVREPGIMLDALVAAALAREAGMPPLTALNPARAKLFDAVIRKGMPIAQERGLYLCSSSMFEPEKGSYETRYVNRRFPVMEAARYGQASVTRIDVGTGLSKSYRIPVQQFHVVGDVIRWYVVGNRKRIEGLLSTWIQHVGKKRSIGCGKVARWSVEPVETWPGFPVLREGLPLRPLPLDWPGDRKSVV